MQQQSCKVLRLFLATYENCVLFLLNSRAKLAGFPVGPLPKNRRFRPGGFLVAICHTH